MSLKTILINCATEIGLNINNSDDRNFLIAKINESAEDLYTSDDLVDCLREQVFSLSIDDKQISLPFYVYKIRGTRWSSIKMPIRLDDMRPRYATLGYNEMLWRGFTWRIKEKRAIERDISNAAPLTLSVPISEPEAFTVNITGRTSVSRRITETISFSTTDTSLVTINTFLEIESITKNILTINDITITDTNGLELAILPNSELSSSYTVIQIVDFDQSNFTNEGCQCVELLYKLRFTPFHNDYDEFPCGPIYDQAIFYKFLEIYHGKNGSLDKANAMRLKCNEIVGNIAKDTEIGEDLRMDFGKNRFLAAQNRGLTQVRYNRGWNWNIYPKY